MFDATTGAVSISTSVMTYRGLTMDLQITCTSQESVHMQSLRTVTDTFSINFVGDTSYNCETDPSAFLMLMTAPEKNNLYNIDGTGATMIIRTDFYAFSEVMCPALCTLYEGFSEDTANLS